MVVVVVVETKSAVDSSHRHTRRTCRLSQMPRILRNIVDHNHNSMQPTVIMLLLLIINNILLLIHSHRGVIRFRSTTYPRATRVFVVDFPPFLVGLVSYTQAVSLFSVVVGNSCSLLSRILDRWPTQANCFSSQVKRVTFLSGSIKVHLFLCCHLYRYLTGGGFWTVPTALRNGRSGRCFFHLSKRT